MLKFGFDEAEEMLLIHRRRVVDMRINLSDIIIVSMRHSLAINALSRGLLPSNQPSLDVR